MSNEKFAKRFLTVAFGMMLLGLLTCIVGGMRPPAGVLGLALIGGGIVWIVIWWLLIDTQ